MSTREDRFSLPRFQWQRAEYYLVSLASKLYLVYRCEIFGEISKS